MASNIASIFPVRAPRAVGPTLLPTINDRNMSQIQKIPSTLPTPGYQPFPPAQGSNKSGAAKGKANKPTSGIPAPDPEVVLKHIIETKPPKKEVVEFLQKRCNELSEKKMK